MRKLAIILLTFGVIGGYASALGHWRHHGSCGYDRGGRWVPGHWETDAPAAIPAAPTPAPAAAPVPVSPPPQIIVVQPQAAPAAAPTIVVQPAAPLAPVAPKSEAAKPPATE
jgi:hypothetical protein